MCGLLLMKTSTLIYRNFRASWTAYNVGAMWTTQKNLVNNSFKLYNLKSLPLYKVRSLTYY